jgi:chromatin assembly factor 1 subunit B
MDTVLLYDTAQAAPFAVLSHLHYAPITDLAWSADASFLAVSSEDGYCSVITFKPVGSVFIRLFACIVSSCFNPGRAGKPAAGGSGKSSHRKRSKWPRTPQSTCNRHHHWYNSLWGFFFVFFTFYVDK